MVALITGSTVQLATPTPSSPPRLRVIRGGLDPVEHDRSALFAIAAVLAVFAAVLGLRAVQGSPPVGSPAASVAGVASSGPLGAGDTIHVVVEGDTLWSIAEDLAPGRDPRPVVDALAARNGGTALRAGDLLVIPGGVAAGDAPVLLADGANTEATP